MNRFRQLRRDLEVLQMIVSDNLQPKEVAARLRKRPSQIEKIFAELESAIGSKLLKEPRSSEWTPNSLGQEVAELVLPLIDALDAILEAPVESEPPEYYPASFDTDIAARRQASEFFRLPFEVCFGLIVPTDYQPVYLGLTDPKPRNWKDCSLIKRSSRKAFDVWFRCDENSGAELRDVICNDIGDIIPHWLKYLGEGFTKGWSEEIYGMRIVGDSIELYNIGNFGGGDDTNQDETDLADEFIGLGMTCTEYEIVSGPTALILDAEGSRVKVLPNGRLAPATAFSISDIKNMSFSKATTKQTWTLFDQLAKTSGHDSVI